MDRRGLPNNVFGVWGKGDPPAVGLDDRGHRGLLGGHTTLDALVIFQDAVEMGEGDRSLGMVGLCECGGGGLMPGSHSWGLVHFLGILEALAMSLRALETGSCQGQVARGKEH